MPFLMATHLVWKNLKVKLIIGCFITILFCTVHYAFTSIDKDPIVKIPFQGKSFTTDNLGNVFIIGHDNSIVKYSPSGTQLAQVNFKIYGNISQLDVSNPFEIYAFYRDQQTLLILDNMLSVRAEISLSDISASEVSAAARSFDNGIWYYNASTIRLYKVDKNLEPGIESSPLAAFVQHDEWLPHQLLDNGQQVFAVDSLNGVAVHDVFANFQTVINTTGIREVQSKKDAIIYFKSPHLLHYNYRFLKTDTLHTDSSATNMRFESPNLYLSKRDTIYIQKH